MKKQLQYILNVNIIAPETVLNNYGIIIKDDRILEVLPMDNLVVSEINNNSNIYYGEGAYVSAGFIDIHSDNIETVVQPRPTSVIDFRLALSEHEKQLVNQGITTMYHSLSFLRAEGATMRDKEVRKPKKMREMAELIKTLHEENHLIRHRFHCRYDIRNCEGYDTLMDYIDNDYVHLLSFIDHTPGQGQYRNLIGYRENLLNHQPNLGEKQIDSLIEKRMAVPKLSQDKIEKTATLAYNKGIPIASHDDDSEAKVEFVNSILKAYISEFPVELSIARKAKEEGMYIVVGAPNVLIGKSHSGNLTAIEAILDGSADIMVSDYYPSAMLHAVFKLYLQYNVPLWKSMNMVTLNPSKAVGIDKDFGSVEKGKKADLLLIKLIDEKPAITKVFVDGQLVSELNYRRLKYA
ncbi:alpha-D-ribose 1-methylphosphonate 5-triphosphate diphosphatase [Sedimentibacter sp. MB31-C6]|uniref:alpha-D-ribose 1-methylphosphonate 5-triphosphate diphosphatase n=1 Tax=Sedimentibacter sp. MB31-C6 TaxID=3109366 RepID=UPI002DDCE299|nr:alpha-D-ribose 1-methylphosphonate 5-triphosphate diphosphatase [Sedimentibacter sp. MB36-C1]WSI03625.1 alpha-D-ribose 1-methylphosphonate 5-triphosphate diphosphatase [Sedimentibacter sp. MB36-C1]